MVTRRPMDSSKLFMEASSNMAMVLLVVVPKTIEVEEQYEVEAACTEFETYEVAQPMVAQVS